MLCCVGVRCCGVAFLFCFPAWLFACLLVCLRMRACVAVRLVPLQMHSSRRANLTWESISWGSVQRAKARNTLRPSGAVAAQTGQFCSRLCPLVMSLGREGIDAGVGLRTQLRPSRVSKIDLPDRFFKACESLLGLVPKKCYSCACILACTPKPQAPKGFLARYWD